MNFKEIKDIAEIIKKQLDHCADNTRFEINNIIFDLGDLFKKYNLSSLSFCRCSKCVVESEEVKNQFIKDCGASK